MAIGASIGPRYTSSRNTDERVTYTLRLPEKRPRSGVNSLALGSKCLYAAGRDGIVRSWAVCDTKIDSREGDLNHDLEAHVSFDEHVDWVNAVLLVHNEDRLVTASSDTTVKVWNVANPSRSLRTLMEHTDYVKALAPLADGCVVSGSLDGRILMWDLTTGSIRHECGVENQNFIGSYPRSSVYCLASSQDSRGSLVVSGSTDRTISVFDCRTGENIVRLRGHTDAVRCLTLKHDSTLMLSGSSDTTVRLWDLRQQRCIRTFDSHPSDSIWSLDAGRQFESFVTGGRDGTVWHSSLDGESDTLAVAAADPIKRCNMVLDVCLVPHKSEVWVGTTGSSVRLWKLPPVESIAESAGHDGSSPRSRILSEQTAGVVVRDENMLSGYAELSSPILELKGLPTVVSYKIMNNRRHVMTCDTLSEVELWDITRGRQIRSLGKLPEGKDLEQFAQEYDEMVSVPSWFQVDIRLGSLAIRLDRSSISNAEIYAIDADLEIESEDTKVNIGEHVLRALFASWKAKLPVTAAMNGQARLGNASTPYDHSGSTSPQRGGSSGRLSSLPPYEFSPEIPVIVTEESPVPILQRRTGAFSGDEDASFLPGWVIDVVRDGKTLARDSTVKIGFNLFPCEGSSLPELTSVNLTAARVLRVRKVAAYVAEQLNIILGESGTHQEIEAKDLDILCHGKTLDHKTSLATVRQFLWRSPDDLQLHYKLVGRHPVKTSEA